MKKLYVLLAVCLSIAVNGFSQDFYWIGPDDGNWNGLANWSHTSGGASANAYPQLATDNVIFNANANINLNTSVLLNSLSVIGSGTTVKITGIGGGEQDITVHSSSVANPALYVAAGCKLESNAAHNDVFYVLFAANSQGVINGDWTFSGDVLNEALASFFLGTTGSSTRLNVNTGGSITIANDAFMEPNLETGDDYLVFNAGATLNMQSNSPSIPVANYNASSIINITGVTNAGLIFDETGSVGNIRYDCGGQSNVAFPVYLNLLNLTVKGSLNILNTNNKELVILNCDPGTDNLTTRSATVKGDLNIQGNSKVTIAKIVGQNFAPSYLFVEGNVIANGTSFDFQANNTAADLNSRPTILFVKGNVSHTAGTFTASSAVVNQGTDLFILEMNGTANQTISSHSGTFDNVGNQFTLRINNAAGVTLLSSLEVGRLNFNTANKGILTTNANTITLNNTTPASVSNIVLNMPSNPSLGFVNGNIRRKSASTEALLLASGSGANYGGVTLIPSSTAVTTFEAKFTNSNFGGTFTAPVRGIAPYYWDISRIGAGANADVQFALRAAVPGALFGHDLVVAKYDGSNWVSAKGTTGVSVSPGNSSSGTVRSETQTAFGTYTIAYASEAALPTLLVSFTAKKTTKETAELKWKITDNSTPSIFEVMRSGDGVGFVTVGTVLGIKDKFDYDFTDNSMIAGNNYYRLKMVDKDGVINYSTIIVVSNTASGFTLNALLPTVVNNRAKLTISSSKKNNIQLMITNIEGRVIQKQTITVDAGNQDVWINASRLAPGMYQISGFVPGEKTATIRFIKQ